MCNLNPTKDETSTDHNGWNRCWRYCRNVHHDEAFTFCLDQWLEQECPVHSVPGCCASCGGPDRDSDPLLPCPVESAEGTGQVLLHVSCAPGWYRDRTAEAVAKLASLGIEPSSELEEDDWRVTDHADGQHQTFAGPDDLDRAIHEAVGKLNTKRNRHPLANHRIAA